MAYPADVNNNAYEDEERGEIIASDSGDIPPDNTLCRIQVEAP